MTTFRLGKGSRANLIGVHEDLVMVVELAIKLTTQDFTVHDGARTLAEQKEFVRRKVSKTLKSRHLVQSDGLGHAVDLVPFINDMLRWEWGAIYPIAVAMRKASDKLNIALVWGGVWDKAMHEYGCGSPAAAKAAVEAYKKRHPGDDFIDGPHFELAHSKVKLVK